MGRMNVEALTMFPDGSQLLISTRYTGEGGFTCALYVSRPLEKDKVDLRIVMDHLDGQTCRQAQEAAFSSAQRLYPERAENLKRPPYLVWPGPTVPLDPDNRGRRQAGRT